MPPRKNARGKIGRKESPALAIKFLIRKRAKDLSTAQLLRLLDARQNEMVRLQRKKQKLEKELAAIDARLLNLQGAPDSSAAILRGMPGQRKRQAGFIRLAKTRKGLRRKGVNRAALLKFLAQKGTATIPEMQAALAKAGGNAKYVNKTIQRMMSYQEIERVPNQRGVYRLK